MKAGSSAQYPSMWNLLARLLVLVAMLGSFKPAAGVSKAPAPESKKARRSGAPLIVGGFLVAVGLAGITGFYISEQGVRTPTLVQGAVPGQVSTPSWEQVNSAAGNAIVRIDTNTGNTGTGFLIASDRVLTAAHVVTGGIGPLPQNVNVFVHTADGIDREAEVVGLDPRSDLAVLSIEPIESAGALAFADMDQVRMGAPVAAIGFPYGQERMLTTGVLSGFTSNDEFASDSAQNWLMQSNVAVNPGNSGGPLLDGNGNVLGVIVSRPDKLGERPVESVTLAVPAAMVTAVVAQLEAGKEVSFPRLGIAIRDANAEDVTSTGAVVTEVQEDTPASAAGIVAGDIVVQLNEDYLDDSADLMSAMSEYFEGDEVTLRINRDGQEQEVSLVLAGR